VPRVGHDCLAPNVALIAISFVILVVPHCFSDMCGPHDCLVPRVALMAISFVMLVVPHCFSDMCGPRDHKFCNVAYV